MVTASSKQAPRSVGTAAEVLLGARGQAQSVKRVLDRSPVPMVMLDDRRRYVEVNRPARLTFRLSLAEMRSLTADDLASANALPTLDALWARLLDTGCTAGQFEVASPDGSRLDVVYCGVANALPGLHVFAFAPAGWPEDELGILEDESTNGPLPALTPREQEILQLAASGFSGPSIAERLFVSPATVKTHFANIYEKLGVRDRAGAVAKAMRLGLIE